MYQSTKIIHSQLQYSWEMCWKEKKRKKHCTPRECRVNYSSKKSSICALFIGKVGFKLLCRGCLLNSYSSSSSLKKGEGRTCSKNLVKPSSHPTLLHFPLQLWTLMWHRVMASASTKTWLPHWESRQGVEGQQSDGLGTGAWDSQSIVGHHW